MKQMIALLTAMILLLTLPACGAQPARTARDREVFAMDTVMELRVYDSSDAVLDEMDAALAALSRELNAEDDNGGLYALNRAGGGENAALADLVRRAAALSARTGGALDVSLHLASLAWGFPSKRYSIPTEADLTELANHCGMRLVACEGDRITLQNGAELDLGAIAKGYAADRMAQYLRERGIKSAMIDLGGNILAIGHRPEGGNWRVGIQKPFENSIIDTVMVSDQAVVTSGVYQRYFEKDGILYHHILDPHSGMPCDTGLFSVTMIGASAEECDALSTVGILLGYQKTAELLTRYPDVNAVLVTSHGEICRIGTKTE